VCISYPDLFIRNLVSIESSLKDLESGTLLTREKTVEPGVNMPPMIRDLDQFMDVLFQAWRQVLV
jgi:hypothetical protein